MNLLPQLCNVVCKPTGRKTLLNFHNRLIYQKWCSSGGSTEPATPNPSQSNTKLKKKDGIDDKYELIYKPPNNGLLILATSFCTVSSVICPAMISRYLYDYVNEINVELTAEVSNFELIGMGAVSIFSIFAVYICTSIPMRIYKHEKEYVAILPSLIPGLNRAFYFKKGDIKDHRNGTEWGRNLMGKILPPGFQTASFYKIKNHRILLTTKCFERPIQFFEMFGNSKKYLRKLKS